MEHDAGESVHHGGKGGDGQNVAGDFDGALFGGALDFLESLGVGHRTDVPNVVKDGTRVTEQESGEFAIVIPGAGYGAFVNLFALCIEEEGNGRDEGLRAVEANVALALLFGIVKGMRVEERPDELAADVFEAEFEIGVLVTGVMAAVKGGGTDVEALLVGDFFGADQAWRVAGASGGDGGIEGMGEVVAEGDARRAGFNEFAGARAIKHARLSSHDGSSLYTGGGGKEVESRRLKVENREKREDNAETLRVTE